MPARSLPVVPTSLLLLLAGGCTDRAVPTEAVAHPILPTASIRAPEQSGIVIRSQETYAFSFFDFRRGLVVFASTHAGYDFCGEEITPDVLADVKTVFTPAGQSTIMQLVKGDAYVSVYTLTDQAFEDLCGFLTGPRLATGLLPFSAHDNDLNFDESTSSRTNVFGVQSEGTVQLTGGGTGHLSAGFRAQLSRSNSGEVSFDVPVSRIVLSGQ